MQDYGKMVIDPQNVANKIADHYYTVNSNDGYGQLFIPIKEREENKPLNFAGHRNEEYNASISMKEISSALSQCRNTAPGLDGIRYEMLRHLADTAFDFLLLIYNKVWIEECFPEAWGKAVVLSFLKKDEPPAEPESYRAIALTSCVCKLLERIINNRLQYILEKNNLLSQRQCGFRKMRGTEDAHVLLQTAILDAFALKQ